VKVVACLLKRFLDILGSRLDSDQKVARQDEHRVALLRGVLDQIASTSVARAAPSR
jgi:hypothetical protein